MRNGLPKLTEKEFMAQVAQLARLCGWRLYHTFDSRRSACGFPDLVLLRGPRLLVVELKTDRGRLTVEQKDWLWSFERVSGIEVYLWHPRDWDQIERVLAR